VQGRDVLEVCARIAAWRGNHAIDILKVEMRRRSRNGAGLTIINWNSEDNVLRDDINNALKDAMKAKDERKISTLRLMNSTIKNADIEARGAGKGPLPDGDLAGVFQKMIKQRQESRELYEKGGRPELAKQEADEITIIQGYLPKQMSDAEVSAAIDAAIKETGAAGMKDMGKVIGALKAKYAGQMDFGKASGLVKGKLAG
jgi:uncharacterized protein YqeY